MISTVKRKIMSLAEVLHLKIFGYEMSKGVKDFTRNLTWSFLGGGIASLAMLVINILVGRYIGPEEYGKYILIITLSQIFMIPILFGLDISSVRAIAKSKGKDEKSKNISSALYFVLLTLFLFSLIFFCSYKFFSDKFSIASSILIFTLILTIFTTLKLILDGFIRGLHLFKNQFIARIIETIVMAISFFGIFFVIKNQSYKFYIFSIIIGNIFLILYYFKKISPYIFKFDFDFLKKQLSYGKIILIGTILGTAFNSLDKFIIAKNLSILQLGIYGAYFMASTNLIAQATQMFINVFFPVASKFEDKSFLKKLDKIFFISFIPLFLVISGMVFIIMKLFGEKYGVSLNYVVSFGLLATLQIILTINASIITAISKDLFKKYIIYFTAINIANIAAYGIIIYLKITSIQIIVFFLILNIFLGILAQRHLIKASFKLQNPSS